MKPNAHLEILTLETREILTAKVTDVLPLLNIAARYCNLRLNRRKELNKAVREVIRMSINN